MGIKVLWLCNVMPPLIARMRGVIPPVQGGWLEGLLGVLIEQNDVEICVCFPTLVNELPVHGEMGNLRFYGIPQNMSYYDKNVTEVMEDILQTEKPDVIQIFGTEYPQTLNMLQAGATMRMQEKTIVAIQGLVSVYAQHYMRGLPISLQKGPITLRDCVKGSSVINTYRDFLRRGIWEKQALQQARHVAGRTSWDRTCCKWLAPNACYHYCGEVLRETFYCGTWSKDTCEKHSIFVAQSNYPVKGFHWLLQAMPLLLKRWPDIHVYTTGDAPRSGSWLNRQRNNSYLAYLQELIEKYNLQERIHFIGKLDAQGMKRRMLQCNVCVSPSAIENSSNSLVEAMMLGVPVVCSMVGGAQDMLQHEAEGYLYQADAPYMLAGYIDKIFSDPCAAQEMGKNAASRARIDHSPQMIVQQTLRMYSEVMNYS